MYWEPIITLFTDFNSAACAKKKEKQEGCYLEVSRPFVPLSDVEKSGTFPAFQETKAVTNSELDAE